MKTSSTLFLMEITVRISLRNTELACVIYLSWRYILFILISIHVLFAPDGIVLTFLMLEPKMATDVFFPSALAQDKLRV